MLRVTYGSTFWLFSPSSSFRYSSRQHHQHVAFHLVVGMVVGYHIELLERERERERERYFKKTPYHQWTCHQVVAVAAVVIVEEAEEDSATTTTLVTHLACVTMIQKVAVVVTVMVGWIIADVSSFLLLLRPPSTITPTQVLAWIDNM